MSIGIFGLSGESTNPIARIILPEMQTGLNPNLLINPPVIGPPMRLIPTKSDPTEDTADISES